MSDHMRGPASKKKGDEPETIVDDIVSEIHQHGVPVPYIMSDTDRLRFACPAKPEMPEETPAETEDMVNRPNHYCRGGYEIGPMLYLWGLSHRRASAVEYIMRAGAKKTSDEVEDLRKAIRNLEMELEYMEKYGKVK